MPTAPLLDALYRRDGAGLAVPGELSRGPWSDDAQHGGAVAALLAAAAEACAPPPGFVAVRITVDLLRPVPLAPLRVVAEPAQRGRSVERVRAELSAADGGGTLASATLLRMRRRDLEVPAGAPAEPLAPPGSGTPWPAAAPPRRSLVTHGLELRFLHGSLDSPGPATAWVRLRVPVIAGEEPSPLQRVLVAADCANGISAVADFSRLLFVNADLTVVLHRLPAGEWVGMESRSQLDGSGVGASVTTLWDQRGPVGASLQSLLVAQRST